MCKFAQNDQEDDEARYPAVELIEMDNLVAEERDNKSTGGNDNDASPARNIRIDSVEQLCPNNDIDRGPAQTSQAIEYGNYDSGSVSLTHGKRKSHSLILTP